MMKVSAKLDNESDTKPLSDVIKSNWPFPFESSQDLDIYHRKIELLNKAKIEHDLAKFEGEMFDLLELMIEEHKDLSKIKDKSLAKHIEEQLSWEQKSILDLNFQKRLSSRMGKNLK